MGMMGKRRAGRLEISEAQLVSCIRSSLHKSSTAVVAFCILRGRLRGVFSENRNIHPPEAGKILKSLSNAPKAVIRSAVQADPPASPERLAMAGREGHLRANGHLLGLCWVEFQDQAAVRWNDAGFCGSLKRPPSIGRARYKKRGQRLKIYEANL